jgi:hypothetical protein
VLFVCHAHEDEDLGAALRDVLVAAFDVDRDQVRCTSARGSRLHAGARIAHSLRRDIAGSTALLAVLTPDSRESRYVWLEIGAAWGQNVRILPLLARGAKADDVLSPLGEVESLDLTSDGDCGRLIDGLRSRLRPRRDGSETGMPIGNGLPHAHNSLNGIFNICQTVCSPGPL